MMDRWVCMGRKTGKKDRYVEGLSYYAAMTQRAQWNMQGYEVVAVMRDRRS